MQTPATRGENVCVEGGLAPGLYELRFCGLDHCHEQLSAVPPVLSAHATSYAPGEVDAVRLVHLDGPEEQRRVNAHDRLERDHRPALPSQLDLPNGR